MAGVGALALDRAIRVVRLFDLAGAMSLEALRGTPVAFDTRIHQARSHSSGFMIAHVAALGGQGSLPPGQR
jgi:histidine ammonia-lyase